MSRVDQGTPDYHKRCTDCGQAKPLEDFVVDGRRNDGHGSYCRACFAVRYRAHRERKAATEGRTLRPKREVPEGSRWCPECETTKPLSEFPRNRAATTGYGGYCKPCHNAKGKATYERLYGGTREYHLRRRYGITGADFDAMVQAQGGTCAVCSGKPEHVDHDHVTGDVRGVLCFNCNQALGNARDDIKVLKGLAAYLRSYRLRTVGITMEESPMDGVIFEYLRSHRSA